MSELAHQDVIRSGGASDNYVTVSGSPVSLAITAGVATVAQLLDRSVTTEAQTSSDPEAPRRRTRRSGMRRRLGARNLARLSESEGQLDE